MSRIILLFSGLDGVGKTHLALNLALEMVRRGRQAAIFSQDGSPSSLDQLLALPRAGILQRRSTDHAETLVRRGYLGVDVLFPGIPLSQWDRADEQAVQKIIAEMDCADGYDDFLVDTSGMDPRTLLACCRASSQLILVITADARSRSEAFALLRILQLNAYKGELYLLINRLDRADDGNELYRAYNRMLGEHLQLDVPLLGILSDDIHVRRAERARQAFTSMFPDAEISSQVGVVVDALDTAAAQSKSPQGLSAYWSSFREKQVLPVALPGGVFLEVADDSGDVAAITALQGRESAGEVMLLQLDSSFHALPDALDSLPGLLQATAEDVSCLHRLLERAAGGMRHDAPGLADNSALPQLAAGLIREIEQAVVPALALQLQVNENRVRGDAPDWLKAGCYLRYVFRFQGQEAVLSRIRSFLDGISGVHCESGQQGETLWEMVVADRSGAMNIVHSADDSIRVQIWLPLRKRPLAQDNRPRGITQAFSPAKTIH